MVRVLMIGIEPDEVDFTDPTLPPGLNAEIIRRGVILGIEALKAAGLEVDQTYISAQPEPARSVVRAKLAAACFDCVMIGGGVHLPPRNRLLFETLINVVGR